MELTARKSNHVLDDFNMHIKNILSKISQNYCAKSKKSTVRCFFVFQSTDYWTVKSVKLKLNIFKY